MLPAVRPLPQANPQVSQLCPVLEPYRVGEEVEVHGQFVGCRLGELAVEREHLPRPADGMGDHAAVAGLCARLDGLPLAIELAAARLPGTTVTELAASLQDRFRLLTAGHRADNRHQPLRAVVDWSYHQLPKSEQELFGQLSVFHGWFESAPPAPSPQGRAAVPTPPTPYFT